MSETMSRPSVGRMAIPEGSLSALAGTSVAVTLRTSVPAEE
jgi:hypothetical protein